MRNAFINSLCEEARENKNLWLLTGDIGFSVLEVFAKEFPERYINIGVAEQNMIGVAAGLALSGKTVFTYSIGNFSFMRCMEQIRNEICYHNLDVKVVAVGGGFAYGSMGYTHHAIEDIAMLRTLPNITVAAPGDPVEAGLATKALAKLKGPGYLRLGRGGEKKVHETLTDFSLNRAIVMADGTDAVIVSAAATLDIAHEARLELEKSGLSVGLLSMPILSPFDKESFLKAARGSKVVVTVEEHGRGGLAAIAAEIIADVGFNVVFKKIYVAGNPRSEAGDRNWQREQHGVTAAAIVAAVK